MDLKIFTFTSDILGVTEMTLKEKKFLVFFFVLFCFIHIFQHSLPWEQQKKQKKSSSTSDCHQKLPRCLSNFYINTTAKCSRHYCAKYFDVSLEGRIKPILQLGVSEQLIYMMGPAMLVTIPLVLQEILPYPNQLLLRDMKRRWCSAFFLKAILQQLAKTWHTTSLLI